MTKTLLALSVALALGAAHSVHADTSGDSANANAVTSKESSGGSTTLTTVEVNAALDKSRNQLSPEIGASQYVIDQQAIEQLPLGDATPLNQVLLRAPGVVQDSFGQLHI